MNQTAADSQAPILGLSHLDHLWFQVAGAERLSRYTLEFRVSIDGFSAETNDSIRGVGTFQRALRGIVQLSEGRLPAQFLG